MLVVRDGRRLSMVIARPEEGVGLSIASSSSDTDGILGGVDGKTERRKDVMLRRPARTGAPGQRATQQATQRAGRRG